MNGQIFDREAYLRSDGFEEVEVVVAGRNSVTLGKKSERAERLYLHYAQVHCNCIITSASKSSIRRFVITEKAPTRASF